MVKRSISPTYNHTMVYDGFHTSDLREACAELTVWQRDGLKTHVLGGIRLSCGTGECLHAVSFIHVFIKKTSQFLIQYTGAHTNRPSSRLQNGEGFTQAWRLFLMWQILVFLWFWWRLWWQVSCKTQSFYTDCSFVLLLKTNSCFCFYTYKKDVFQE